MAGIDRFWRDGYLQWSRDSFQQLLGPDVSLDDDRVLFTLYGWEDAGIVQLVGNDEIYMEVVRGFPLGLPNMAAGASTDRLK